MKGSPDTVLVTGASGFVGSAVAAELLERQDIQPLFLVRGANPQRGLDKLREALLKLDVRTAALQRLSQDMIVCGDFASFPRIADDPRLQNVTHVLNAGALASFAWKQQVWEVNVNDTSRFVAAVARFPAVRRFLHVGTAMISGNLTDRLVHEDDLVDQVRQLVPYTRSKAEIERRLPALLGRVPLVIARPSIIVGHTKVGCRASPSIFWLFRLINIAKCIPFAPSCAIDVVPVDYCARALLHLLLKNDLLHSRYHISAGTTASCTFGEIDEAYTAVKQAPRVPLKRLDMTDMDHLDSRFGHWMPTADARQVASAVRVYHAFGKLNLRFDNRRLLEEGMEASPRFTDYLHTCVHTGEHASVAEQMAYDFR